MADKEGPRDWDKELAEIDKLMAGAPPPAAAGGQAVSRPGGQKKAPAPPLLTAGPPDRPTASRRAIIFTWLRLTLGLTLGVAMTQWPYTNGCGLMLFAYLGGVGAVIVASFWSMVSSWRTRSGFAHFLSVSLLLWGTALAAREVLPRIGYAKDAAAWTCAQPAIRSTNVAPAQPSAAPAPVPAESVRISAPADSARPPARTP